MKIITIRDLITTKEAARIMKVHPTTIVRWIQEGLLPAIDISKGEKPVYRINPDDLLKSA